MIKGSLGNQTAASASQIEMDSAAVFSLFYSLIAYMFVKTLLAVCSTGENEKKAVRRSST